MQRLRFLLLAASVTWMVKADPNMRLTAEYETEIKSGKTKIEETWRFVRNGNQVTHERPERTARWTKMSDREIGLEQIFPKEKIVLEFAHSEMKARGEEMSWSSIAQVVDTNLLARLTIKGKAKLIGRAGTLYKGKIDGAEWQVVWFGHLNLAGKVSRRDKNGSMRTVIKKLLVGEGSDLNLREYRRVDYADLGDLESDPAIQRLARSLGAGHDHTEGHHH
jgi:hypothetical protein